MLTSLTVPKKPSSKDAFSHYIQEIQRNLSSGISRELTHRHALQDLVESFSAAIEAFNDPEHIEVGAPDFTIRRKGNKLEFSVGWMETKDIGADLDEVEKSEQLKRYFGLPNLILTDYLEFRWYTDGKHRLTARLAEIGRGRKLKLLPDGVEKVKELLNAFLAHKSPQIFNARELAVRMADIAHLIRNIIFNTFQGETTTGHLHKQYIAFQQTLIPDLTSDQFADMYAQTIVYGLFAARCQPPTGPEKFSRERAAHLIPKTNPFLRRLFNEVAGPELDARIVPFVDDLVALLRDTDMHGILSDFGKRAAKEDPVVHFYEDFLKEYDPKVRKMRGVYYTPEPVVSYIVRSVDYLLKTKFNKPLGLADKDVLILDPACGTGTFLYYVIRHIYNTLVERGQKGQWNGYVSENLLKRIFGFELLMAPYAVAHLKLGLLLQELGYKFDTNERLGIFLTNTLEEAAKKSELLFAQYIADEANAANAIKRDLPIMVVLGNPPYSGISANRGKWISQLIDEYRAIDGKPLGEKKIWVKNDYIKFMRFAQWRIDKTGYGILAFITDHSYLDSPTFRGMRHHLLSSFDEFFVFNLHGNAKRREETPTGGKDENVFDITQGVAIGMFLKCENGNKKFCHADLWGTRDEKYEALLTQVLSTTHWKEINIVAPYYQFVPSIRAGQSAYLTWWSVKDIFPVGSNGIQTSRDQLVVSFTRRELSRRIEELRDTRKSDEELKEILGVEDRSFWSLSVARNWLLKESDWGQYIHHYLYRPFDEQWLFGSPTFVHRLRYGVMRHMKEKNFALCVGRAGLVASGVWDLVFAARHMCDHNLFYRGSSLNFPLYLYEDGDLPKTLFDGANGRRPNLAARFVDEFSKKCRLEFIADGRGDLKNQFGPEDVFFYVYGVLHSASYRNRFAGSLRIDFPRIPLTTDQKLLAKLVAKGNQLTELHLLQTKQVSAFITRYDQHGLHSVEKVRYVEPNPAARIKAGRVYINDKQYFEGVPKDVWEFHIGGYQVCEKWLKDRKGRTLSSDDIDHYQKIVVAINETIRIMREIDEIIPGWPLP